jgi:hypothetical protein
MTNSSGRGERRERPESGRQERLTETGRGRPREAALGGAVGRFMAPQHDAPPPFADSPCGLPGGRSAAARLGQPGRELGMSTARTWFAADKTGFHILHTLFQTSLKFPPSSASTSISCSICWSTTGAAGVWSPSRSPAAISCLRGQGGDHGHRRRRAGVPAEHQRRHRDRRRHGAWPAPRRGAARHGVRAVPPDRRCRAAAS